MCLRVCVRTCVLPRSCEVFGYRQYISVLYLHGSIRVGILGLTLALHVCTERKYWAIVMSSLACAH